ncbi:MAG: beta-ketoacyl synthase N-terminal-like domain-containing protein [Desulfuromonadales bacterium]
MIGVILGIGWVTTAGFGRGRQETAFALECGELPAVTRKDVFAEVDPRFGRLDPFSRIGLAGIALALQDAGLDAWQQKRPVALIAGSRYGCLATDNDYFDSVLPQQGRLASPNLFAYTLPNCFLGEAAIRFGLTGPAYVVSAAEENGLTPLRLALETLAWDEADLAVAGICDLARPASLAPAGEAPPGAVFLVLARPGGKHGQALGQIALQTGKIRMAGKEIRSLAELVPLLRRPLSE